MQAVGIVGAGLVGCVTALALKSKGFDVYLFELRPDPLKHEKIKNLKSINLAVSNRGIRTLELIDKDLTQRIMEQSVPMYGRMIHDRSGTHEESQKYGLFGEFNSSIDRGLLNEILIQECRRQGVDIYFKHKLVEIVYEVGKPKLRFQNESLEKTEFEFDYIIGTDGAHSQFRYQMQKSMRMNMSQNYIDMQYIELYIPPGKDNEYKIDPNHLHIWPRDNFMLIALPNSDGSFTSTFFSSWSLIESIKTETEFLEFFEANFPDAYELLGEAHLISTYKNQPRCSLIQVSAYPYNSPDNKALIIGDAAHSMVPFYGQGMNCGFEDVRILMELLDQNNNDLSLAFQQYSPQRKDDLETICKLAMDNYHEMASKVTHKSFLLRKQLDYYLGKYANGSVFQWIPLYSMISFRSDIPYSKAVQIEKSQQRVVNIVQYTGLVGILSFASYKFLQWYDKR